MRPNILWIVYDTARADALEPYGAPAGASPVASDLVRRGAVVEDVHSTACWTLPSHVSMFAGGLPRQLGLANQAGLDVKNARPIVEALEDRLIAGVLRRGGYSTAAVSANAWITQHSGFRLGFDQFVDVPSGRQARMGSESAKGQLRWLLEGARARADDGARNAELEMRRWIADGPGDPFFWFVNLVECHSPYLPPRPYSPLNVVDRVRAAREATEHLTMWAFWEACVTGRLPDAGALERMRAGYRGAIRYMDDWLGRLLESLEAAGRLEDTLLIVTSDHGENFGEGNLVGHGFSLDERLIRVPFLAVGPGAESLRGVRSLAELPRRLAEIAGLSDHPYDADALPALPVAQFDSPSPGRGHPDTEMVVGWWQLDDVSAARMVTPMIASVDGTLKLVVRGDQEEFYDLVADPLEERPLEASAVDADTVARLRAAIAHPAAVASVASLNAETPVPDLPEADVAELEDRMRLLGYL